MTELQAHDLTLEDHDKQISVPCMSLRVPSFPCALLYRKTSGHCPTALVTTSGPCLQTEEPPLSSPPCKHGTTLSAAVPVTRTNTPVTDFL